MEYAGERIRIGRVQLCRGCALLGVGLLLGFSAGALLPAREAFAGTALAVAILGATLAFLVRLPKFLGRALPGAGLGFACATGLRLGPIGWTMSALALLLFGATYLIYRRRGPHRGPCETCPDREKRPACRGFAPILKRERALQRLAGRLIAQDLARKGPDLGPQ